VDSPTGRAKVYVLGISHVSRESCEEARELIQATRPDVVVLELCKDRLRLLLDQVGCQVYRKQYDSSDHR
jgi:pheromone shutdown protein TraB